MKRNNIFRTLLTYAIIIAIFIFLVDTLTDGGFLGGSQAQEIDYSGLIQNMEAGRIEKVLFKMGRNETAQIEATVRDSSVAYTGAKTLKAYVPYNDFLERITAYQAAAPQGKGVILEYEYLPEDGFMSTMLIISMILVAVIIVFFFMSHQSGGSGKVMNFGKSKARMYMRSDKDVNFSQVAGADEEKEELEEIVDFLKHSDKYVKLGARIPKGVLIVGPPGTGKTLLARATAGEAGVPFFTISGSEFVEMFVGVGASRVRDLFDTAKKNAPCIIFIDEIDAVGRHRGAGLGGGNDEREQTLNQLLVEMDGFTNHQGIIIIAATNRADILDPALLRPGRFDRQITVSLPDVRGREEILRIHAKNKPVSDEIDFKIIAKSTAGFTGADLENVMNESSLLAARKKQKQIFQADVQEAIKRVISGPEKKSRLVTENDKKITAYHETGHALLFHLLPSCDDVQEISIIPRGEAAGYVIALSENDDNHISKSYLLETITASLGGRASEQVMLEDICTGAISDLERATAIARRMITEFGMSDRLGPVAYGSGSGEVFVGRDFMRTKEVSEEVAAIIDSEIKRIIDECYDRAVSLISENKDKIDTAAKVLLEKEYLTGAEFRAIIDGTMPEETEETLIED